METAKIAKPVAVSEKGGKKVVRNLLEEFKNSASTSFSAKSSAPGAAVEIDLAGGNTSSIPNFLAYVGHLCG